MPDTQEKLDELYVMVKQQEKRIKYLEDDIKELRREMLSRTDPRLYSSSSYT